VTPTSTQPPQAGKTRTFVPIQTGALVKKGRWSANMGESVSFYIVHILILFFTDAPQSSTFPTNGAGVPHSTTIDAHHLTNNNFLKPPLLSLPPLLNRNPNFFQGTAFLVLIQIIPTNTPFIFTVSASQLSASAATAPFPPANTLTNVYAVNMVL